MEKMAGYFYDHYEIASHMNHSEGFAYFKPYLDELIDDKIEKEYFELQLCIASLVGLILVTMAYLATSVFNMKEDSCLWNTLLHPSAYSASENEIRKIARMRFSIPFDYWIYAVLLRFWENNLDALESYKVYMKLEMLRIQPDDHPEEDERMEPWHYLGNRGFPNIEHKYPRDTIRIVHKKNI
ncbi:hypothetical protein PVAG01_08428 [Phlyctema vagabunda]|uniref:Uncharacterized protein n=1 Tax=Phlyctema vagabunda TaxID=108571 RepID=A0ABR4P9E5_9HELO